MYNQFFGLRKSPFDLTPDPEFLYLSVRHRDALAVLTYVIMARKGFVVLTGNAGTGKTTLLARILEYLPAERIQSSVIVHPTLTPSEFLEAVLLDFGLQSIPSSKAARISALRNLLWKGHREGRITALIVDEAHKLSLEVLEEIRLFGNFESAKEKLLQIVLVGQSELNPLLNSDSLTQFRQRISQRLALEPLSVSEIEQYIQHRWATAGGSVAPFSSEAVAAVGQVSLGTPRVINLLCNNALMKAFGEESKTVERRHIEAVCRELQFAAPTAGARTITEQFAAHVASPVPAFEIDSAGVFPMRTLERYEVAAKRTSLLSRLAGKFRFMQRIETA